MEHNRMKQQEDQNRSERSFEVGDWVFLRLQQYKEMSLKQAKKDDKLSPKYYGPYKVLQNIGTMAYKLELPAFSRVQILAHEFKGRGMLSPNIGSLPLNWGILH
jgi:hypothetical protein